MNGARKPITPKGRMSRAALDKFRLGALCRSEGGLRKGMSEGYPVFPSASAAFAQRGRGPAVREGCPVAPSPESVRVGRGLPASARPGQAGFPTPDKGTAKNFKITQKGLTLSRRYSILYHIPGIVTQATGQKTTRTKGANPWARHNRNTRRKTHGKSR